MRQRIWMLCLTAAMTGVCINNDGSLSATASAQESKAQGESPAEKGGPPEPDALQSKKKQEVDSTSLESAQDVVRTFLVGMEKKNYAVAVTALDFSKIEPPPGPYEKVLYAQRLKSCIDRLALVDFSQISDAKEGPDVRFPPDEKESPIVIGRCEDGKWRVSAATVQGINDYYEILKDKPPIGSASSTEKSKASADEQPAKSSDDSAKTDVPAEDQETEPTAATIPSRQKSARRVLRTLIESLEDSNKYPAAVAALDFTEFEKAHSGLGPYAKLEYARRLRHVIDRMAMVDYAKISDDPEGPAVSFPPDAENQPVIISRNESGLWRFSSDTVGRIDALYKVYKNKPILNIPEERRPWYARELFLGNEVWRILTLFGAIFASLFLGQFVRILARRRSESLKSRGHTMRAIISDTIAKTATAVLFLIGLRSGVRVLILDHEIGAIASTTISVILVLVVGYIGFRLVDVVIELLRDVAKKSGSMLNDMLVPIVSTSLRLTIVVLVIFEIATLISDQPPSAILAGLGAGGLAVGLAAQDTIKNVFGSVMIFADRPFELGDRIVIDGHDGPVERVGFRSTRIRTLDGHLVTVPNGQMADRTVHNIGKRPYIRRVVNIRIPYDTPPEKVEHALAILRELLDRHEGMKEELPPRVFLHDFLDSAINLRAIYWFHPPAYWDYCDYSEKLNLEIMRRFRAEDIRFALPARRLFMSDESERPDV